VVLGTVAATAAMTAGQAVYLRRRLDGIELAGTLRAVARMLLAAAVLGGVAYATWWLLDDLLGRTLLAQAVSVGTALTLATAAYAAIVLALRVPEARQVLDLLTRRLRRNTAS
jgi:putative peptidoglycan lipid II flippase